MATPWNPLVVRPRGARHVDRRFMGVTRTLFREEKPTARGGVAIYSNPNGNKTKQKKKKYIFMENMFHQLGSNSHPEGLRHCSRRRILSGCSPCFSRVLQFSPMGNLAVVMPQGLSTKSLPKAMRIDGDLPRLAAARTRHKEGREELDKGPEDI